MLVLTTFHVPLFMLRLGQSNLYRSDDYGKTFEDVTYLINHTFIQTEFGIAISPDHSGKVILTGDVSDLGGFKLFRSHDFGLTFEPTDLPFEPLIQMLFNPADCDVLLTLSITVQALSIRFSMRVTNSTQENNICEIPSNLHGQLIYFFVKNLLKNDKGMLELRRSSDYGRSFKTVASRVYSFVLGGRFVFASIMTGSGTERMIHVSVDGGEQWNMAQLPTVNHEQFYSILSASQELVFMHVDDPGDSGVGTVYVSDDRGTVFSKSLERHLYTATGSDTDFTVVSSLRGVYMTSILTQDGAVETVITFNQGARWQLLKGPESSRCDSETSANRPHRCRLHIHATYSTSLKLNVPMLPLSQANAVGLIIAHGSIGESESVLSPDVYISDDGGYSWFFALKGPHHYAILDSGGLIVAVEHTNSPVNQIKYSVDEGQCWFSYNFTSDPFHFSGLDSEPGSRSMNVSLWGYRSDYSRWVVITVDFKKILSEDCAEEDFEEWLSHSEPSGGSDGCVLGFKETFLRLRKGAACFKGKDYETETEIAPCPCTPSDYHCDFGYFRQENSSECVEQDELKGRPLEFCLNGTTEQLQTSGYRKIPGDRCMGGFQPDRKETDLKRKCISNALQNQGLYLFYIQYMSFFPLLFLQPVSSSTNAAFVVHRYSVMRDNVEANKIEGVDDVDTNYMETAKAQYNEDSDQVYMT
uniref:Sortilin 1a n=1 Tax=Neogobius melanostomus TaxID=47308 RepID=A0A8C6SD88_9GOBI